MAPESQKSGKNRKDLWEKKAREVYREGAKMVREGLKGLEVVAGKAFEVGGLNIINTQTEARIKRLYLELGHEIYGIVSGDRTSPIPISKDILILTDQIRELSKLLAVNKERLKHSSVSRPKNPLVGKRARKKTKAQR